MVRFALAPQPPQGPRPEPYRAQLALSRVHPHLVPLFREQGGYAIDQANSHGFVELPAERGLAGYGLARALRLLLDVLSALSALHETQTESGEHFTHGEVVPALIRVDGTGAARLIPLAAWHASRAGVQPSAARLGHLAPERLLGDPVDQRADVFSAGVLLWEALAGRRLFEAASSDEIIVRLMGARVALPELPPELAWALPLKDVAMRALAVDPEQRFASVADLTVAIERVAAERVASHAEVAAYLVVRDPHAQASSGEQSRASATHNSSLSALVLARPEAARASSPARAAQPSARFVRGFTPRLLAALGLSLLVLLGAGVAGRAAWQGRNRLAPTPTAGAPSQEHASALPRPPDGSWSPPSAAVAVVPQPPGVSPEASARAPTPSDRMKALKPGKGMKASPPKLKAPVKAAPGRDKALEQYGI